MYISHLSFFFFVALKYSVEHIGKVIRTCSTVSVTAAPTISLTKGKFELFKVIMIVAIFMSLPAASAQAVPANSIFDRTAYTGVQAAALKLLNGVTAEEAVNDMFAYGAIILNICVIAAISNRPAVDKYIASLNAAVRLNTMTALRDKFCIARESGPPALNLSKLALAGHIALEIEGLLPALLRDTFRNKHGSDSGLSYRGSASVSPTRDRLLRAFAERFDTDQTRVQLHRVRRAFGISAAEAAHPDNALAVINVHTEFLPANTYAAPVVNANHRQVNSLGAGVDRGQNPFQG